MRMDIIRWLRKMLRELKLLHLEGLRMLEYGCIKNWLGHPSLKF